MAAHTCHSSYAGGIGMRNAVQVNQKKHETLTEKSLK
jgi:hypothetical protein